MCPFVFVLEPAPMSPAFVTIFSLRALLVALRLRKPLFKVSALILCGSLLFRCIHQCVALMVFSASFLFVNVVLLLPPPDPVASPQRTHHCLMVSLSSRDLFGAASLFRRVVVH